MSKAESVSSPEQLKTIVDAGLPVLIDFWAPWCGPCKSMGPIIDDIATDFEGRLRVVKIDVDQAPELAAKFGIRAIPTALLVKGPQTLESIIGITAKSILVSKITPHL